MIFRSCSTEVRDKFSKGKQFSISKIHYLILRSASDIILQYGNAISCRMLERNIWSGYIEGIEQNLIAYHMAKYKT